MVELSDFQARFPGEFTGLRQAYAEVHRAYHDWRHIEALLAQFRHHHAQVLRPEAMLLAILYHDCIYDSLSKTNERDSAARMRAELGGRVAAAPLADAETLIIATETHTLPQDMDSDLAADCALFLDMDLSILGADAAAYNSYEAAIREEYAVIPDDAFGTGRKAVLTRFLDRAQLYFTEIYRTSHEAPARTNLARAIAAL